MYDKLRKVEEKNAKFGVNDSKSDVVALANTINIY